MTAITPSCSASASRRANGVSEAMRAEPRCGLRCALRFTTPLVALIAATGIELGCAPRPATREVVIQAFAFSPATDTIQPGDTVRWSDQDLVPHTATSRIGGFDSGTLEAGEDWRYVARAPGKYEYECTLHPTMRGVLVVR